MTAQSWRSHYEQKYQYSLRLFLLLNLVSSVLSLVSPLFTVITFTLPCFLIVACSTVLLLWHCKFSQHKINIPVISLLFGLLWAWHVALKGEVIPERRMHAKGSCAYGKLTLTRYTRAKLFA